MSDPSLTGLSLSSLPADIIREIILIDGKENLNCARLISQSWNTLVSEYLNSLPPIEDIQITAFDVFLLVHKRHLMHFKSFLPKDLHESEHKTKDFVRLDISLKWFDQWESCLKRLLLRTYYIKNIRIKENKSRFKLLSEMMGTMKIDSMVVFWNSYDPELRNIFIPMIQRHQIINIAFIVDRYEKEDLQEYLSSVSKSGASIIYIGEKESDGILSQDPQYWDSVAVEVVENNSNLTVIMNAHRRRISLRYNKLYEQLLYFYSYFDEYF